MTDRSGPRGASARGQGPPHVSPKEPLPKLEQWGPELARSVLQPLQQVGAIAGSALGRIAQEVRETEHGPDWWVEAQRKAQEKLRGAKTEADIAAAWADIAKAANRLGMELADPHAPFSTLGAMGILSQSALGRDILARLPASTRFEAWERPEGAGKHSNYNREDDLISIRHDVDNVTAAVMSAHEIIHADQVVNRKHGHEAAGWEHRSAALRDEIEGHDKQIDVWRELKKPTLSDPNFDREMRELSALRDSDRRAYEQEIYHRYPNLK